MATKVDQNEVEQQTNQEASELDVLFPDREVVIAGKTLTVRELRFAEQLKWQSLLNEIAKKFDQVNTEDADFFDHVLGTLGSYADQLLDMVALCCDQPREWVNFLPPSQGEELLFTWWSVNNNFFIRRLLRNDLAKIIVQASVGKMKQGGGKSLLHSSDQDITKTA